MIDDVKKAREAAIQRAESRKSNSTIDQNNINEFLDVEHIREVLRIRRYTVTESRTASDDYKFSIKANEDLNEPLVILTKGTKKSDDLLWGIEFVTWWKEDEGRLPSLDEINEWNRNSTFGKLYIDKDGDLLLQVAFLTLWVGDLYFARCLDRWSSFLDEVLEWRNELKQ